MSNEVEKRKVDLSAPVKKPSFKKVPYRLVAYFVCRGVASQVFFSPDYGSSIKVFRWANWRPISFIQPQYFEAFDKVVEAAKAVALKVGTEEDLQTFLEEGEILVAKIAIENQINAVYETTAQRRKAIDRLLDSGYLAPTDSEKLDLIGAYGE